jgi:hypothetical protein
VIVKAMSERGVRLHIKKQTLRRWRLAFADVEHRWQAIRASLLRDGRPDLAEEVGRFLDVMPPPRTDREQIACELSAKVLDGWVENTPLVSR